MASFSFSQVQKLVVTHFMHSRPSHAVAFLCNVFLLLTIVCQTSHAKYLEGYLETKEKWHFLARYCFLSDIGRLQYYFEYPVDYSVQRIGLYYDGPDQWPAAYKSGKSCEKKRDILNYKHFQFINLTVTDLHAQCIEEAGVVKCGGGRSFRSARERWWFVAVFNCNSTEGLKIHYRLTMTNGRQGEIFKEHFSADQFYILETDMSYLFAYFLLLCAAVYIAATLRTRQLFHSTYKLFMLSAGLKLASLLLLTTAYGRFGHDGVGLPTCKALGEFVEAGASLSFQLLLVLLAKGYTITRGRLRHITLIKITVFFTLYSLTNFTLYFYQAKFLDPGLVLYLYESPPGYGLVGCRVIGWTWCMYATFFTCKHYPEKHWFYRFFVVIYTFWFWSVPVIVVVASNHIDKWAREKIVNGVMLTVEFLGHFFFLLLTLPSHANANFPYHVRTTQVATLGTTTDGDDNFRHHIYAAGGGDGVAGGRHQTAAPPATNFDMFTIIPPPRKSPENNSRHDIEFVTNMFSTGRQQPPTSILLSTSQPPPTYEQATTNH